MRMDKHTDIYYAVVTVVHGQQWVNNLNPICTAVLQHIKDKIANTQTQPSPITLQKNVTSDLSIKFDPGGWATAFGDF